MVFRVSGREGLVRLMVALDLRFFFLQGDTLQKGGSRVERVSDFGA